MVYPSGRPSDIAAAIQRARSTTTVPLPFAVAYNGSEPVKLEMSDVLVDYLGPLPARSNLVDATNIAMRRIVETYRPTPDDIVGYWSDDFWPRQSWAEQLLLAARRRPEIQYFCASDQMNDADCNSPLFSCCAPFGRWSWFRDNNGGLFWHSEYRRWACDNDNYLRAWVQNAALFVGSCSIPHHNHATYARNQRPKDDLDKFGDPEIEADRAIWNRRMGEIGTTRKGPRPIIPSDRIIRAINMRVRR